MDNLQTPQSQETKDFLEKECGLRPYAPTREPNYANPDKMECKFSCESIDITLFLQITCLALESSVCPSRAECTQDRLVFPPFLSLSLSSWCLPSTSWQFTTRKSALTSHRVSVRPSSRTSSSTQSLAAHGTVQSRSTTDRATPPPNSEHLIAALSYLKRHPKPSTNTHLQEPHLLSHLTIISSFIIILRQS